MRDRRERQGGHRSHSLAVRRCYFKANIEGAEKIFEILKPKLQEKDQALVATLTERFKTVHDLLDKHKKGDEFKFYNELSAQDTKELAEAVNKLGEPLAQMGVILK